MRLGQNQKEFRVSYLLCRFNSTKGSIHQRIFSDENFPNSSSSLFDIRSLNLLSLLHPPGHQSGHSLRVNGSFFLLEKRIQILQRIENLRTNDLRIDDCVVGYGFPNVGRADIVYRRTRSLCMRAIFFGYDVLTFQTVIWIELI